jgi:AcrR family transcriptional regulator
VSRHFPTKEALFDAIVLDRIERCIDQANELAATEEPGAAIFAYLAYLVEQGAMDRGLADALTGAGFDVNAVAARSGRDYAGALGGLLARAQRAGAVGADIDIADVKALIAGCLARERDSPDATVRRRMMTIMHSGLRADAHRPR